MSTTFQAEVKSRGDVGTVLISEKGEWPELPKMEQGQRLDIKKIRDPMEAIYMLFVLSPTIVSVAGVLYFSIFYNPYLLIIFPIIFVTYWFFYLLFWCEWKLAIAWSLGNSIKVNSAQYPQIFRLVTEASEILGIQTPTVLIFQGHGMFELFVAKYFSKRGFILLTSTMMDDLSSSGSSRELMFFIGRQLGLIANGYFRFWFFKNFMGMFAFPFLLAWHRRCHFTADRLGLLVAGDLYAAEQAMIILTAGASVAPSTSIIALKQQRDEIFDSIWTWIVLVFSNYPYMVDRIIRLRSFAYQAVRDGVQAKAPVAVGSLPIAHCRIRALQLMIVHGHDHKARLEVENFLFRTFPHVSPISMIIETSSAATMPEKFEETARKVKGAVVLLTPDDVFVAKSDAKGGPRARQNVILEIGWCWAHMGRTRFLLLMKQNVEIPSDLSGVDVHRYQESPTECSECLRDFIEHLSIQ
jgi:Zn-dependent protease with chaperone function